MMPFNPFTLIGGKKEEPASVESILLRFIVVVGIFIIIAYFANL